MNWFKIAQQIEQQYDSLLNSHPSGVNITGSGLNETMSIGGQLINAKDIMNKVISSISTILNKNMVKEINTDPISNPNAQGVAISNEPGKVHVDVKKIFNKYKQVLPANIQTDGLGIDKDSIDDIVAKISQEIYGELVNTSSHESKHNLDYTDLYKQNQPFSNAQEQPAVDFGNKTEKEYKARFSQ